MSNVLKLPRMTSGGNWFDDDARITYCRRWDEVLKLLQETHGDGARVAIYPNAEIQY